MQFANPYRDLPDLETPRLRLRRLTLGDAEDMFEYASNPAVARYTAWDAHTSIEDSREFISIIMADYVAEQPAGWCWGIELKESRKLIGTVSFFGAWRHNRAEMGYVLGQPYWGQGLATEAAGELLWFGFSQVGFNRIEAECLTQNTGSARVMEKNGMVYEGTMRDRMFLKGKYEDLKLYAILRRDYEQAKDQAPEG